MPDADANALRRLLAATLSEAGLLADPDRLAVLLMQRMACAGWCISRTAEKETDR